VKQKFAVNVGILETENNGISIVSNSVPPLGDNEEFSTAHILGLVACRAIEEYIEAMKIQKAAVESSHGENPTP
jgi:hypothetical protein